ncbi:hypothetical protein [Ferrimonas gelatinilytica]|uniref:Uncharacterized protein n=1 Tax=Ferrimonas gelatinilytica TaxID=1255257 RepID=A0ABP9RTE6_9GAMM
MSPEITIGLAIALGLVIIIGIKVGLHRVVRFKMDESAIQACLKAQPEGETVSAIANLTGIDEARVEAVCQQSKGIQPDGGKRWRLDT